jgi:hypothetical protein
MYGQDDDHPYSKPWPGSDTYQGPRTMHDFPEGFPMPAGFRAEPPADEAEPGRGRGARVPKARRGEQPAPVAAAAPVYVPVQAGGRSIGYAVWRLGRWVVLMAVWVALTLFKLALQPFKHIGGRGSRGGFLG